MNFKNSTLYRIKKQQKPITSPPNLTTVKPGCSPWTTKFQILQMDQTIAPETAFVESASRWREKNVGMLAVRGQDLGASI